jgi:hypothetical protein
VVNNKYRFRAFLENVFAAIGLLALIGACAFILLSLDRYLPDCDVRITNSQGMSCYQIKERK